ncbi:SAM-dependent methyltransferase [Alcaligenaceae bacterium]|nr:SAM-dependent methyltransferase [Alcaligenaceae bacterium]
MRKPNPMLPTGLPTLDPHATAHLELVQAHISQKIANMPEGFMPFDQWMDLALYAPGLGYYAAESTKFGSTDATQILPAGDFTTAPELSPLFGQTLARQVAQILEQAESVQVLEFGAGSGALAAALIPALQALGINPDYQILDVSADLKARQQQRLQGLESSVTWLTRLPDSFSGCIIANEVLDAMPATLFRWDEAGQLTELGVKASSDNPPYAWDARTANSAMAQAVSQRMPPLPGYQSEINLRAEAWITEMGKWLQRGAALLIDYGFPQREYYHPQRAEGTLMCHFRHHAHGQPLIYAGLQDITTHVDFTAMADAALAGGLDVLGYTSQARFLMNAGLPELLTAASQDDGVSTTDKVSSMSAVQKLLSEAEMGELFKVLAIGRGITPPLMGFMRGDRRDRL